MDWLAFISSIVKTLVSWPVAAVITLFVLKRQVAAVFLVLGGRLSTMKLAGLAELTFTEGMGELEGKLPSLVVAKLSTTPAEPKQIENLVDIRSELSKLPPAYVVSQAWLRLLENLYEAVETVQPGAGIGGNRNLPHIWIKLDCTGYCFLMRNLLSKSF